MDIDFNNYLIGKDTTNERIEHYLALIVMEILAFFGARLKWKAGKWFVDKSQTIRF